VSIKKKRHYESGHQPTNTRIGTKRISLVRARGGHIKHRALRLETGNFSWGTEAISRKSRIMTVSYNSTNNELVRTNTLVKGCVVTIDSAPFRQWYFSRYGLDLGVENPLIKPTPKPKVEGKPKPVPKPKAKKEEPKKEDAPKEAPKEGEKKEGDKKDDKKKPDDKKGKKKKPNKLERREAAKKAALKAKNKAAAAAKVAAEAKKDGTAAPKPGDKKKQRTVKPGQDHYELKPASAHTLTKRRNRLKGQIALDQGLLDQFKQGKIFARLSSSPGQVGRADGYVLEGEELNFYLKKLTVKKKK